MRLKGLTLTNSCAMNGTQSKILHKLPIPIGDAVNVLGASTTPEEAQFKPISVIYYKNLDSI